MTGEFDRLIQEALDAHFSGWDFSYLKGRLIETQLPWDYRALIERWLPQVNSLLDMGTGGGEFLASLSSLPAATYATEGYAPNVPIARQRLEPLGITVFDTTAYQENEYMPFADASLELIINRHEIYQAAELLRVLKPGGRFITQQVGGGDNVEINKWLEGHGLFIDLEWTVAQEITNLETAGFKVVDAQEAYPPATFKDIGALVYYLNAIPWQIEDFSVEKYQERLLALHEHIKANDGFVVTSHRFIIEALAPS